MNRVASGSADEDTRRGVAQGQQADGRTAPRLGEFILESRLGKGGMGTVFLARKGAGGGKVALKVLNPTAGADADLVRRFRREADFMLALEHPNIVRAYEVGTADGRYYLSMEYVEGGNLLHRILEEMRIEPIAAMKMMRQVADALCYGAGRGVVHRDLKPENILIGTDGVCKLADMGLAILARREDLRLTAPGTTLGTPSYMSPEQARADRDIDMRSDIYSLGCTFFHAICGRPPFFGENAVQVVQQHLQEPPPRPSELAPGLPAGIENILLKCLEKERERRFQSCDELVAAIDSVLSPGATAGAPRGETAVRGVSVTGSGGDFAFGAGPAPTPSPARRRPTVQTSRVRREMPQPHDVAAVYPGRAPVDHGPGAGAGYHPQTASPDGSFPAGGGGLVIKGLAVALSLLALALGGLIVLLLF